jgi:hydrogenase nickel incorporation protein HypA/HybF
MHEYSIVAALSSLVEAHAARVGAIGVRRLHVSIGELSGVDADLLAKAYEIFRERTLLGEASLEIRTCPASWSCPKCERPIERGEVLHCDDCGVPACLSAGDEIILERIEMEVP